MQTLTITGMTCAGSARKVETTLKAIDPSASVTLEPPRAILSDAASVSRLNDALAAIGKYRVAAPEVAAAPSQSWLKTYYPLLLVVGLVGLAALAGQDWMHSFMAGFFIVFGAFKLLDVPNFANAYARYDVIAKRFKPWASAYPFVETGLGFAFLFNLWPAATLWAALVLSLVGAIGVIQANLSKTTIQCACLGAVFQLPMSVVTIIENLGMAAMAAWMLFLPQFHG